MSPLSYGDRKKVQKRGLNLWHRSWKDLLAPTPSVRQPLFETSELTFGVFFDFFWYFRGLFWRPLKSFFLRLFWDFGPGGTGDSCKSSLGWQANVMWHLNFPEDPFPPNLARVVAAATKSRSCGDLRPWSRSWGASISSRSFQDHFRHPNFQEWKN